MSDALRPFFLSPPEIPEFRIILQEVTVFISSGGRRSGGDDDDGVTAPVSVAAVGQVKRKLSTLILT